VPTKSPPVNQYSKPTGLLGRFTLSRMNSRHSKLTDWGLHHISIENQQTILDIGCGGGRTIHKLAAIAKHAKVYGIDYSEESVAATKRTNAQSIALGRVEVLHGSVSQLPVSRQHVRPDHHRGNPLLVAQPAQRHPRSFPRPQARRHPNRNRRSLQRSQHYHLKASRKIRRPNRHDPSER
jgi:SAM-dependent methyltransferase